MDTIKVQIDNVFKKDMTRKEFLQNALSGALVVVGAGSFAKALRPQSKDSRVATAGYGASPYGGSRS